MKSTQQWLMPTVTVASLMVTIPSSFVATDGNKVVFEVKMVGKAIRAVEAPSHGNPLSTLTVITHRLDAMYSGGQDERIEPPESGTDSAHSAVNVVTGVSHWVLVGFHLAAAALVLCAGHVTLTL